MAERVDPSGASLEVVERVNAVAEYFYSSERKCWSDKLSDILELVPIMMCFIKACRDRRSYSNNEKDYFTEGQYKTFNMSIRTYKRWVAVFQYEELQAKAKDNNLTNNEIDDFIQRKKREQSSRRGKYWYGLAVVLWWLAYSLSLSSGSL